MKRHELIVVGAGPAGLSAAIEAKKSGMDVIVFDENARPGGQLFKQIHKFFGSKEHYAKTRGFRIGQQLLQEGIPEEDLNELRAGREVDIPVYDYTIHDAFQLDSRLKGEDWGAGWMAATTLKPHEDVSIGLVYRSQIRHKISGDFHLDGKAGGYPDVQVNEGAVAQMLQGVYQQAYAGALQAGMPASMAAGFAENKVAETREGLNAQLVHWRDTVRVGVGMEYDFTDWICGRIGYTYDEDPSRKSRQSTMLPAGDRHIIGFGTGIKLMENLRLDLGYNFIRMNNQHYYIETTDYYGNKSKRYMSCHNGYSHLVSASLCYSF